MKHTAVLKAPAFDVPTHKYIWYTLHFLKGRPVILADTCGLLSGLAARNGPAVTGTRASGFLEESCSRVLLGFGSLSLSGLALGCQIANEGRISRKILHSVRKSSPRPAWARGQELWGRGAESCPWRNWLVLKSCTRNQVICRMIPAGIRLGF